MLLSVVCILSFSSMFLCENIDEADISIRNNENQNKAFEMFTDAHNLHGVQYVKDVPYRSNIYGRNSTNSFQSVNEPSKYPSQVFLHEAIIRNKWNFKRFSLADDIPLETYDLSKEALNSKSPSVVTENSKEEDISASETSVNTMCFPTQIQTRRKCLRKIKKIPNSTEGIKIVDSTHMSRKSDILLKSTGVLNKVKDPVSESNLPNTRRNVSEFRQTISLNENQDLPCTCFWHHPECGCNCTGSLNYDNFMNLSKAFIPCQNFTFTINGGHHYALPPNLFSNLRLVGSFNFFITNATFEYLCDPTPMTSPFTNVKFVHSALIRLKNVSVRRGWNWEPFGKLNGATEAHIDIVIEDSLLRRLTSDFSNIGNGIVEKIDVANSRLSMIGSSAFETFVNMTHFRLPDNKISHIRRTEFPEIPLKLVEIDLRNNLLTNLDDELFSGMPSLREISLAGNPLKVLSEKTFHHVIARVNLLGISDIPLNCDCNLKWIKDMKLDDKEMIQRNLKGATCKRPRYLRGVPFSYLSKEHLLCF